MMFSGSNDDPVVEIRQVLAEYDLGELVDYERNERGFVNTSFAIETVKDGVRARRFLRKYKPGIREEELLFEHTLTGHLSQRSKLPVACVHFTREGQTCLRRIQANGEERATSPAGSRRG